MEFDDFRLDGQTAEAQVGGGEITRIFKLKKINTKMISNAYWLFVFKLGTHLIHKLGIHRRYLTSGREENPSGVRRVNDYDIEMGPEKIDSLTVGNRM